MFTATSHRAVGLLREDGSDDESANVSGDRGGRRVRPSRRRLRAAAETETCWIARRARGHPQPTGDAARRPGTLDAVECTSVHAQVWCVQRGRGKEPKELGPPQLDSAKSVPGTRTEGSGNRVSVKRCHGVEAGKPVSSPNAASPAPPQGETGDVNRSRRRLTPDDRPVVDLSTRAAPEGAQAKARSADRGAFVLTPPPIRARSPAHRTPGSATMKAQVPAPTDLSAEQEPVAVGLAATANVRYVASRVACKHGIGTDVALEQLP